MTEEQRHLVWRSELYFHNVQHLNAERAEKLIRELNDVVMEICSDYGVE
jgi:hypothetical protein